MTEDDTSAGGSKVSNPPGSSSGSNAAAPSTISPLTSSSCSQDAADATAATLSTDARSTEPSEGAGYLNASSPASADDRKEDATSSARARVFLIRDKLADAGNAAKNRYQVVSESTDDFVHENPWKAIALATLTGVIAGMLAAR